MWTKVTPKPQNMALKCHKAKILIFKVQNNGLKRVLQTNLTISKSGRKSNEN